MAAGVEWESLTVNEVQMLYLPPVKEEGMPVILMLMRDHKPFSWEGQICIGISLLGFKALGDARAKNHEPYGLVGADPYRD